MGSGLIFLPGKGNGTFGSPMLFSQQNTSITQQVLVADLNNDKKLDLVWNGAVYLGNGDGTFQQAPLCLAGTPLAISDFNGDGIPDLLMGSTGPGTCQHLRGERQRYLPGYSVLYRFPARSIFDRSVGLLGDVNADGHPDMILQYFDHRKHLRDHCSFGGWSRKVHSR